MTDQLKKIFIKKYPTIDRIQYSDIYSYPHPDGCERAYFTYTPGHDIMIQKKPLGFTIETGHRGNSYLLKNQREKYIGFIDGIIRQMLKNAKN
ncbi:hypothetical protein J4399_05040 [Candidatus Woesearchaeota archaeon]|nr:hypothetical protein [Candidatus Woesearchaeota archaeon]